MTPTGSTWRFIRCRVLRLHYWKTVTNPDGERYVACVVCREEEPDPGPWTPWASGGIAGGL